LKTSYLEIRDEEGFPGPLDELQNSIGVKFNTPSLLRAALTHPSFWGDFAIPEQERLARSYERLEFLGDAVLSLAVCAYLFTEYPDDNQGLLSKAKGNLVSKQTLLNVARRLNLENYIRVGKGVEESAGRGHASFLVDCLESLLGAVFLDQGFERAAALTIGFLGEELLDARSAPDRDFKTSLQELVQKHFKCLPRYKLVSQSGPEHHKLFAIDVYIDGVKYGSGEGYSKKEAEIAAAHQALEALKLD